MTIVAYLDVTPEPGDNPIDVRDRTAKAIEHAGLRYTSIEVVTETAVITKVAEEKPKPRQKMIRRIYQSPLYPGTDEFHEFYNVERL